MALLGCERERCVAAGKIRHNRHTVGASVCKQMHVPLRRLIRQRGDNCSLLFAVPLDGNDGRGAAQKCLA